MKTQRLVPVALVLLVLIGLILVQEPLRDMYAGKVLFNWVGYTAFMTLTIASGVAVFMILRARRLDADFRGVLSEVTRIVAFAELAALMVAWALYMVR